LPAITLLMGSWFTPHKVTNWAAAAGLAWLMGGIAALLFRPATRLEAIGTGALGGLSAGFMLILMVLGGGILHPAGVRTVFSEGGWFATSLVLASYGAIGTLMLSWLFAPFGAFGGWLVFLADSRYARWRRRSVVCKSSSPEET